MRGRLLKKVTEGDQERETCPQLPENAAQGLASQYLSDTADHAIRRGIFPRLDGWVQNAGVEYCDQVENSRVWLDPDLLSLPPDGVAGTRKFVELLDPEIRAQYEKDENMVRGEDERKRAPKPFLGIEEEKYGKLIRKLFDKNLVGLQDEKPTVVDGVFAVPKEEGKQRLIIDARAANAVLREPPKVFLPNPGHLANRYLGFKGDLHFWKSDTDNFYHRLAMPEWLHQYFCLPKVMWKV